MRAGPAWEETALLFTWDDPGGFFDHVPPPMRAPAPDNQSACFCAQKGKCADLLRPSQTFSDLLRPSVLRR